MSLFSVEGFQQTTVKRIAEEASVSEQTVYNAFGDKIGVLCAVGSYAMSSDGIEEEAFVDALAAEPDPRQRIRMTARFSRDQWQEGALELDLMLSSPETKDPRLIELAEQALAHRLEVNRAVCAILFPDSIRRAGVTIDEIAAFATTVDSAPSITTLLRLGWTMDEYEDWLVRLLDLFIDPEADESGG